MIKPILFFCLLVFTSFQAAAKLQLAPILANNMVLQQNSTVKIWGSSTPNKVLTVKVSWTNTWFQTQAKPDGSFEVDLFTPAGSFQAQWIKISNGADQKQLQNILIGEVWLCSGQSNMAMTFRGYKNQPIADAQAIITDPVAHANIRTFNVEKEPSYTQKNTANGSWILFEGAERAQFSAVAYFYALQLQETLKVPVGLINSSYGGSTVEGWLNTGTLEKYPDTPLVKNIPDSLAHLRQSVFFNNMIRPLRNYKIKGVLWYQGEGNADQPQGYAQKLQDLIFLWRFTFSDTQLPFYLVEIAPFRYDHPTAAAVLREEQSKVALNVPNCGIISTSDLVPLSEANCIHPPLKKPIGTRLANVALNQTYHQVPAQAVSPRFSHYKIEGNTCILYFDHAENGFLTPEQDKTIFTGFEIADASQKFISVVAKPGPTPNSLILALPAQNFGPLKSVRYCFKNYEAATVFNQAELPLFPFRTDDWK